jgi:ribosomal-protein-alanine N-acetyltransferase
MTTQVNDSSPVLQTARLKLEMPPPSAASSVVAYLKRNKARFAGASPSVKGTETEPTVEEIARALEMAVTEHKQGSSMRLYMFARFGDPQAPIGDISLSQIMRGPFQACFLGYRIDALYEGHGYVSEALGAVVKYAFEILNLHRIMANYAPTNVRSGRLLRRAGFVVEGYARDYLHLNGNWQDHILTSITNPRWTE